MTVTITATGVASMALDAATGLLGYTTSTGFFRVVDPATGERVENYNLGGALGGFAFGADGSAYIAQVADAAYWTDEAREGILHHLDRQEPAVDNITWALDYGNSAATDIAIAANGLALVTVTSQWTPLYVLNTTTGEVSQYAGESYNSYYSPRVTLSDGGRYALVQEVGSSGGTVHLWDSETNTIIAETSNFENSWDNGYGDEDGAVSEAAGLIVQSDLHVYDMNLQGIADLGDIAGRPSTDYYSYHGWDAVAFATDGSLLYAVDGERDLLIMIDTATLTLADARQIAVPEGEDAYEGSVSDMIVTADGMVMIQAVDVIVTAVIDDLTAPTIAATTNGDVLVGSAAADRIDGLAGDDDLIGARGDDTLSGGEGADALRGGGGDDVLSGGHGDDTLTGGAGIDTYFYVRGDQGRDEILGFEMHDVIRLSGIPAVQSLDDISLLRVGNDVTVTITDDLSMILRGVTGSVSDIQFAFSEFIAGTGADDQISGTEGDDVIEGYEGDDLLIGAAGDDLIVGGAGADIIWGDAQG